ncbi:MAG: hypothetical protein K0S81_2140 [Rhodospirillales bacterium]|jgi:hypothetical protein|nr:hypothetical protein [Rhodospirillales bacterium]
MSLPSLMRRSLAVCLVGLASCTLPVERPDFPELTWTHLPPITLDVAEIEIIDATQPTGASPHVEHLFPLPPAKAAERWARDRLRAGGTANRARFIIQRAEVVEVGLRQTEGISGVFTKDQSERYDAELGVLLEIRSDAGPLLGQVTAELRKSRTVREDASLNERESIWFAITDDLAKLLNAEMERTMPQYLGRWIQAR